MDITHCAKDQSLSCVFCIFFTTSLFSSPLGSEKSQQLPEVLFPHLPQLQPGPRPDGDGLQRVHQRILR